MALRVIIADDHPIVLIAVQALLERDGQCEIVARASTTDELVEKMSNHHCDVLVTDFSMPGHGEIRYDNFAALHGQEFDQLVHPAGYADDFDMSIALKRRAKASKNHRVIISYNDT